MNGPAIVAGPSPFEARFRERLRVTVLVWELVWILVGQTQGSLFRSRRKAVVLELGLEPGLLARRFPDVLFLDMAVAADRLGHAREPRQQRNLLRPQGADPHRMVAARPASAPRRRWNRGLVSTASRAREPGRSRHHGNF